ncbi:MAG: YrhA family protein [Pseudomonadales bacterium]|nr:YrhA family protein [Pseudomonadales bacterium]
MKCFNLIEQLAEEYSRITGDSSLPSPATDSEILLLIKRFVTVAKYQPASEYIDFLKRFNGLTLDGIIVYKVHRDSSEGKSYDGLLEANEAFWEDKDLQGYIAYGEDDTSRIVFNLDEGQWQLVDRSSWDEIERFESFDGALCDLLAERV